MCHKSLASCLFSQQIRLHIGLYSVYIERWLTKIHPKQLYITTLEEYKLHKNEVVNEVLRFLDVG